MDPGYETVMDLSSLIPSVLAIGIHAFMVLVQTSLALFLIASGAHGLFFQDREAPASIVLRRFGAAPITEPASTVRGALRAGLGALLGLPLLAGVPFWVSLLASSLALVLLLALEWRIPADARRPGLGVRRTAIALAAMAAVFMLWEREDAIALGVELSQTARQWRSREVSWQIANDAKAPKVGDLAPDFELRDPSGRTTLRLSDFRGKRPVALIFGSYT